MNAFEWTLWEWVLYPGIAFVIGFAARAIIKGRD